jgi:hypothetical protein
MRFPVEFSTADIIIDLLNYNTTDPAASVIIGQSTRNKMVQLFQQKISIEKGEKIENFI